ncbi:MAG TPA: glycoside hydrolase family 32 protein [Mucilaginibacter sp.]|nr:glycoside hydrolase family 32 protein [Mucilaginibacter sp.]
MIKRFEYTVVICLFAATAFAQKPYHEQFRPQVHFSPPAHWMNDPNGMVYYRGVYHLFYQYYPGATVWGPMHWGHATSTDLVHWTNKPIALYPDSLGYIFSGSAVIDHQNTSGFGKNGQPPMVAIFTSAKHVVDKDGEYYDQNQSIAYSNDAGKTWHKYVHNPVLRNPNVKDFRDPKVSWYAPGKKWIMTLAVKDHIEFYSSSNLKSWTKESEFGQSLGAHGGVWECPDLFPMTTNDGKKMWVLIVNINPGGPQGGSATQYFVGDFNGRTFAPNDTATRWLDQGTDEYAGVTWSNTGGRRIFLGWMSNWQYATSVPTKTWRSAMTIPRELKLVKVDNAYYVAAEPVKEFDKLKGPAISLQNVDVEGDVNLTKRIKVTDNQYELDLSSAQLKSFSITLFNAAGQKLLVGYDEEVNSWYIDRTQAGESAFNKDFAKRFSIQRIAKTKGTDLKLIVDAASVELFADHGLTIMTSIFFPHQPLSMISLNSPGRFRADKIGYIPLISIWP